jgi:peptidoglycan/LPS O-acetylase OafA/YrhL
MIALLSLRRSARVAVPILVTAIVLVALNRARLYHASPGGWLWIYGRTDTRADALLVGALLAQLWVRGLTPGRWFNAVAWVALVGSGVVFWTARASNGWLYYGGYTLIAVGFAAIILAVLNRQWAPERVLRTRVLGAIGIASYAAYLWHGLVFNGVIRWLPRLSPWARVAVGMVLTAAVAALSWFFVERPFLRWKASLESRARERDLVAADAAAAETASLAPLEPTS